MIWLAILWFVFAVTFLVLGCYHWATARKSIPNFQVKGEQFPEGFTASIKLMGIDFSAFVSQFNEYIAYYNRTTKRQNQIQALGYWVASLTAVLSCIITIITLLH